MLQKKIDGIKLPKMIGANEHALEHEENMRIRARRLAKIRSFLEDRTQKPESLDCLRFRCKVQVCCKEFTVLNRTIESILAHKAIEDALKISDTKALQTYFFSVLLQLFNLVESELVIAEYDLFVEMMLD